MNLLYASSPSSATSKLTTPRSYLARARTMSMPRLCAASMGASALGHVRLVGDVGQRPCRQLVDEAQLELRIVVVLDPRHELQRRLGQLHRRLRRLELRAVDDVGPVHQLARAATKSQPNLSAQRSARNLVQTARFRIEELVRARVRAEVLLVGGRGERRARGDRTTSRACGSERVAEVDHGVDVAVEALGRVDVAGAVRLAGELERRRRVDRGSRRSARTATRRPRRRSNCRGTGPSRGPSTVRRTSPAVAQGNLAT